MPQLVRKYCKLFAGVREQVCKALQGSPCSHFSLFPEGCLHGRRGVSELGNLGSLAFFSRCPRQSTPFCTWCRVVSLQWHLHGLTRTVWNSVPRWLPAFWLTDSFSYDLEGHEPFCGLLKSLDVSWYVFSRDKHTDTQMKIKPSVPSRIKSGWKKKTSHKFPASKMQL